MPDSHRLIVGGTGFFGGSQTISLIIGFRLWGASIGVLFCGPRAGFRGGIWSENGVCSIRG